MPRPGGLSFINALGHIGLWFSSLLVAVLLFSLVFSRIFVEAGPIFPIFRITLTCALPVACLYMPVLIVLRNTEEQRMPIIILLGGILIGPASIALWGLVLQWTGGDSHTIWHGDPLTGVGGFAMMLFALIVGSLTTFFYIFALKVTHRRWSGSRHSG
ncbi:MAG TPA: hypothetical protein VK574_01030 [Terracidiphilus sp.]|nr:hypothetical protein [Terracidiphilus sp.]